MRAQASKSTGDLPSLSNGVCLKKGWLCRKNTYIYISLVSLLSSVTCCLLGVYRAPSQPVLNTCCKAEIEVRYLYGAAYNPLGAHCVGGDAVDLVQHLAGRATEHICRYQPGYFERSTHKYALPVVHWPLQQMIVVQGAFWCRSWLSRDRGRSELSRCSKRAG